MTTINNNNASIETAMENTLSRDGTSPNSMGAHLDMDSHRILNLPSPVSILEPLRVIDATDGVSVNVTDIGGPLSTTDNAVIRWDGTTGDAMQDSVVVVSDTGAVTGVTDLTASSGLRVGFTGTPTANRIEVASNTFYIDHSSTDPVIVFDTGDQYQYDRSNNQWVWAIGGTSNAVLSTTSLRPATNDTLGLGTASVSFSDLFLAEGGVINWDNGDVTVTQNGNSLTIAGGNLIFPGTATNDSASAGQVGEIMESTVVTGSAVALTTATSANVTSISLTAGDWDVWGNVWFSPAATTSITRDGGGISTTSATMPTSPGAGARFLNIHAAVVPNNVFGSTVGMTRVSLASTTTVYLVAEATFTVSTLGAYGYIGARRVR
jgi:hypothetical protein